jgi:glycosyltransferase involved in cell wall biosynthesis
MPESEIRQRHSLGARRVILCVAAMRPHKNQETLIRAATLLDQDTVVVLAGHAEPYELELKALTRELGLEERVRFVGYVSGAELEGLWSVAACAVFPTLGEGFGIPVLEALAHGVPVAASSLPVLQEVGGELPHFFDPRDRTDAARAIRDALEDTRTAELGPARAGTFTWDAAARGTHEVYERVLSGGGA